MDFFKRNVSQIIPILSVFLYKIIKNTTIGSFKNDIFFTRLRQSHDIK